MLLPLKITALILPPILPDLLTRTVLLPFEPHALILASVICVGALAVEHAVVQLSLVLSATLLVLDVAMSKHRIKLPASLVTGAVGPPHGSLAMAHAAKPLTVIHGTGLVHVLSAFESEGLLKVQFRWYLAQSFIPFVRPEAFRLFGLYRQLILQESFLRDQQSQHYF